MLYPKSLIIFAFILVVSILGTIIIFPQMTKQNSTIMTKPDEQKPTLDLPTDWRTLPSQPAQTMAWIYPGEPACAAAEDMQTYQIDILKPEYFLIDENGELTLLTEKEQGCNAFSLENLNLIKAHSAQQYVTVAAADAARITIFLENELQNQAATQVLVDFVVEHDLAGIELDFEDFAGWDDQLYQDYRDFLQILGDALHQQNKLLMVDGPAIASAADQASYVWRYRDFMSLPVDQLVIMAYDYQYDHGAGTPIAPLDWLHDVADWTLAEYPNPSKLTFGLPVYGYRAQRNSNQFDLLTYEQIREELGFETAARDESSQEMTWQRGRYVYFYNDPQSLDQKKALLNSKGITSISVWHLGDNPWFTSIE